MVRRFANSACPSSRGVKVNGPQRSSLLNGRLKIPNMKIALFKGIS
jgi:hypothetical protein